MKPILDIPKLTDTSCRKDERQTCKAIQSYVKQSEAHPKYHSKKGSQLPIVASEITGAPPWSCRLEVEGGETYGSLKDLRISLYLLKFLYDMPNQQTYWLHIPSIFLWILCQSSWITWKSHQVGWCMSSQAACCVQQCWFCCCEVGRKKWNAETQSGEFTTMADDGWMDGAVSMEDQRSTNG